MNAATQPLPSPVPANEGFVHCWNEILTPKWIRFRHLLSGNGKIHSDVGYAKLPIEAGHRILDVACGFGESCLELARQAGPAGHVTGLDCTRSFLEIAEQERVDAGADNVEYVLTDIEASDLPAQRYDVAVSRFGMMYCASPVRGLKKVFDALVPGGHVGLVTWRPVGENPCWHLAEVLALEHLPPPGDDADTCGPGPFSMAREQTNQLILDAAGFEDVEQTRIDRDLCMGVDLEEAVDYQLSVGPAGFVIREAGEAGAAALPRIRQALKERLAQYRRADGSVWLPSSTLYIQARRPA